jgi:hypothetical protein
VILPMATPLALSEPSRNQFRSSAQYGVRSVSPEWHDGLNAAREAAFRVSLSRAAGATRAAWPRRFSSSR